MEKLKALKCHIFLWNISPFYYLCKCVSEDGKMLKEKELIEILEILGWIKIID